MIENNETANTLEPITDIAGVSEDLTKIALEESAISTNSKLLSPLNGVCIGVSISASEEIEELGLSEIHQKDYMIEVARHLLVQGATLAYGGDLRSEGYTYLFSELSNQYRNRNDRTRLPFKNFFHYPVHQTFSKSDITEFKVNRVEVIKVDPPAGIETNVSLESIEGRYLIAKSLTEMRKQMNSVTNARIFVGGKNFNYKGVYPGIIEEAYYAMEDRKPTYFIGSFGGATGKVIESLMGGNLFNLDDSYFRKDATVEFTNYYNQTSTNYQIKHDQLNQFFNEKGIKGLCEINGLCEHDNARLFLTPHLQEAIYLIMKGLNATLVKGNV